MKVDLFKRPIPGGDYSYLAVPNGKPIPNEATNVDWEADSLNIDLEESDTELLSLLSEDALEQISAKGYAITHTKDMASRTY